MSNPGFRLKQPEEIIKELVQSYEQGKQMAPVPMSATDWDRYSKSLISQGVAPVPLGYQLDVNYLQKQKLLRFVPINGPWPGSLAKDIAEVTTSDMKWENAISKILAKYGNSTFGVVVTSDGALQESIKGLELIYGKPKVDMFLAIKYLKDKYPQQYEKIMDEDESVKEQMKEIREELGDAMFKELIKKRSQALYAEAETKVKSLFGERSIADLESRMGKVSSTEKAQLRAEAQVIDVFRSFNALKEMELSIQMEVGKEYGISDLREYVVHPVHETEILDRLRKLFSRYGLTGEYNEMMKALNQNGEYKRLVKEIAAGTLAYDNALKEYEKMLAKFRKTKYGPDTLQLLRDIKSYEEIIAKGQTKRNKQFQFELAAGLLLLGQRSFSPTAEMLGIADAAERDIVEKSWKDTKEQLISEIRKMTAATLWSIPLHITDYSFVFERLGMTGPRIVPTLKAPEVVRQATMELASGPESLLRQNPLYTTALKSKAVLDAELERLNALGKDLQDLLELEIRMEKGRPSEELRIQNLALKAKVNNTISSFIEDGRLVIPENMPTTYRISEVDKTIEQVRGEADRAAGLVLDMSLKTKLLWAFSLDSDLTAKDMASEAAKPKNAAKRGKLEGLVQDYLQLAENAREGVKRMGPSPAIASTMDFGLTISGGAAGQTNADGMFFSYDRPGWDYRGFHRPHFSFRWTLEFAQDNGAPRTNIFIRRGYLATNLYLDMNEVSKQSMFSLQYGYGFVSGASASQRFQAADEIVKRPELVKEPLLYLERKTVGAAQSLFGSAAVPIMRLGDKGRLGVTIGVERPFKVSSEQPELYRVGLYGITVLGGNAMSTRRGLVQFSPVIEYNDKWQAQAIDFGLNLSIPKSLIQTTGVLKAALPPSISIGVDYIHPLVPTRKSEYTVHVGATLVQFGGSSAHK